jgi:acrylyl-CoA reductase (NADPH)
MFRGILIEGPGAGQARLTDIDEARLPAGDVTVRVSHSSLNYKDALAITGKSPVVRAFPMVPGIDLAGVVEQSADPTFREGEPVLLTGAGIGETRWGGLAQKARVSGAALLPLPSGLGAREAMAIGTAGFTAMLCVMALERHGVTPKGGAVLVTGANGGVGSFAISLLSRLGYRVIASTGRLGETGYLEQLGAAEVIDRAELAAPGRPLGKERWAGAVDSVGSHTLANVCACTERGGAVAACGLAQGMDFPATVAPFILRGVSLLGIDSNFPPRPARAEAWQRLSELSEPQWFESVAHDISLDGVVAAADQVLAGHVRGRLVVDVNAR